MNTVEILPFEINSLNHRKRLVRVILPKSYSVETNKRYPVLYMHDGQNLIDPAKYSGYSWDVSRSTERLVEAQKIPEIIIIGIDCDDSHRIEEYTHSASKRVIKRLQKDLKGKPFIPEADRYGEFIVHVLKPFIDSHYRTMPQRQTTGIAGSSCGGNVSLYLGEQYDDVFSIVGAFSPAYWIIRDDIFQRIKNKNFKLPMRIYHDMGGRENGLLTPFTLIKDAKRFEKTLINHPQNELLHQWVIDPKATHTELFWQDRFPGFLEWAFGFLMQK